MQAELEQTYPRLGTIYSLCSVYYPNIRQRSDVLNRRNFLKTGFYEGIKILCRITRSLNGLVSTIAIRPHRGDIEVIVSLISARYVNIRLTSIRSFSVRTRFTVAVLGLIVGNA